MASISNPWKGLSSYTEGEIIYGRDKDIENLFTLITTNKEITILYGQSGIGKTSLLRAGLFPWLRSSHIFPVYVRLGHDELDKSYVDQVIESVEEEAQKYDLVQTDLTNDTDKPKSLWEYLHRYDFHTAEGEKCVPMIFFDQFEELFTISSHRTKYVDEFVKDLGNILNETTPDYLLASTKGKPESNISEEERNVDRDKEPDLNLDIDLEIDEEEDNSKFKTQRDFLLAISIREDYIYNLDKISSSIPALKRNRYFLHGLDQNGAREVIKCPVKNLVDDHVTNEIIEVCHNDNEKYISPAFLSLLMYNLFDRMQQKGMSTISSSLVKGSIGDIFYSYYVNAIKGLPESTIDFLEDRLVSKGGFRLAVPVSDANAAGVTDKEIDQLESKRLIVRSKRGSHDFIELTHDLLCKEISKDKEERDEVKRRNKSKRRSLILVSMLAILLAILVTFKYQSAQLAKKQSALYMNQSRAVAAKAEQLIDQGDTYTATMLALEVLPEDLNKPNRPYTAEAERALRRSVLASNTVINLPEGTNIMAVSPDEKVAAVGFVDGSIGLWDLITGRQKWTHQVHEDYVLHILFSPDGKTIASSSYGKTIQINDVETGENIGSPLQGHTSSIISFAFSPDGKKIASTSEDGTIRIWDFQTRKQIAEVPSESPASITFSPDGKKIATSSTGGLINFWDAESLQQIGTLKGHKLVARALAFSPNGKRLASGSNDQTIRIWNTETYKQIDKPLEGHTWDVNSVIFSPKGDKILSASSDGTIRIWDALDAEHQEIANFKQNSLIWHLGLSKNGDKIYSYSGDNSIGIRDLSKNTPVPKFAHIDGRYYGWIISPNGRYIALNYLDSIVIRELKTVQSVLKLSKTSSDFFERMAFSPSSKEFATISNEDTISIWDIGTGKLIRQPLIEFKDGKYGEALSHDMSKIVTLSMNNKLQLWKIDGSKLIEEPLENNTEGIFCMFFTPDDKKIITASEHFIQIRDANSLKEVTKPIIIPKEYIRGIAISPNGNKLVISTDKENIYILDPEKETMIKGQLPGSITFTGNIFTNDGKFFMASNWDHKVYEIRIFDIETGRNVFTVPYEANIPPLAYSFADKGREIITFHHSGDIYNFEFKPLQELMDEQRELFKDRKLAPEERHQYYLE